MQGVQYVPKSLFFFFFSFFSLNRQISEVLVAVAVVKTTAKATPKTNDLIGSMKKNNRAALANIVKFSYYRF